MATPASSSRAARISSSPTTRRSVEHPPRASLAELVHPLQDLGDGCQRVEPALADLVQQAAQLVALLDLLSQVAGSPRRGQGEDLALQVGAPPGLELAPLGEQSLVGDDAPPQL